MPRISEQPGEADGGPGDQPSVRRRDVNAIIGNEPHEWQPAVRRRPG